MGFEQLWHDVLKNNGAIDAIESATLPELLAMKSILLYHYGLVDQKIKALEQGGRNL